MTSQAGTADHGTARVVVVAVVTAACTAVLGFYALAASAISELASDRQSASGAALIAAIAVAALGVVASQRAKAKGWAGTAVLATSVLVAGAAGLGWVAVASNSSNSSLPVLLAVVATVVAVALFVVGFSARTDQPAE